MQSLSLSLPQSSLHGVEYWYLNVWWENYSAKLDFPCMKVQLAYNMFFSTLFCVYDDLPIIIRNIIYNLCHVKHKCPKWAVLLRIIILPESRLKLKKLMAFFRGNYDHCRDFNKALLDCSSDMCFPFVANLNFIKQHERLMRTATCSSAGLKCEYLNRWSLRGVKGVDVQYAPKCEGKWPNPRIIDSTLCGGRHFEIKVFCVQARQT